MALLTLLRNASTLWRASPTAPFGAFFLGSGSTLCRGPGSGVKMLEMNAGPRDDLMRNYLGLRHGPMSAVHGRYADRLFPFPSSRPRLRGAMKPMFSRNWPQKQLAFSGGRGEGIPAKTCSATKMSAIPYEHSQGWRDDSLPVLDVIVGQIFGVSLSAVWRRAARPDSHRLQASSSAWFKSFPCICRRPE